MTKWISREILVAPILLALAGCGIKGNNDGVLVRFHDVPASTQTFAISGSVLSGIGSRDFARSARGGSPRAVNQCASASCSTLVVGSGGKAGPSCSVSNGTFTIDSVPQGQQLVATFHCGGSTQNCIVMSGDNGITCDPIADGVIQGFLGTMGKSSLSDPSFQSAPIAQIAHSIQQATQNTTTASTSFASAVTSCQTAADPKACNLNAIKNSPFAGPLTLMKTMVNGWDATAIFTFLTDVLGFQVSIDSFVYTDFGARLDVWLSTDFVAQTKAVVSAALTDQGIGGNAYSFKVICQTFYTRFQGGGTITYTPRLVTVTSNGVNISVPTCSDPNDGSGPLSKNGFTSTQITSINDAISTNAGGQVNLSTDPTHHDCNESNSFDDALYFCVDKPEILITTKATEANRNDPLGINKNNFVNTPQASIVNTFPGLNAKINTPDPPDPHTTGTGSGGSVCMTMSGDGTPNVVNDGANGPCNQWFGGLMASVSGDFAGVMGIYMALANNKLGSNSKLSLNDIFTLFSGPRFIAEKLTFNSNEGVSIPVNGYNFSAGGGGHSFFVNALLNDTGNNTASLDPEFTLGGLSPTITPAQAQPFFDGAHISYADSLKMFETIPSASTIHDFIFKSAYHVDYNPTGSSTFYAVGNANSGGTDPIFCKMTDKSTPPLNIEVDMATQPGNVQISCAAGSTLTGVSVDGNGKITVPTGFSFPYILTSFGFQGDSQGGIFALADWKTGNPATPNGNRQFVYQENASNPVCKTNGEFNTVVQASMAMSNGKNTFNQLVTAFCMDLSSFTTTNFEMFYFGGNVQIPVSNANCPGCVMGGSLVGGFNSNDTSSFSTPPVCAWSNSFTTASTGLTSSTGTVVFNGTGQVTSMGDIVVDYCTASHPGLAQYNLLAFGPGASATVPSGISAQLIASSSGSPSSGSSPLIFSTDANAWITIDGASLNTAFVAANSAGYRVAPLSAPANFKPIQLANSAWQTKFDPYCDASTETDGKCHCTDSVTNLEKSGADCSLEDTPKDSTISQPPFFTTGSPTALNSFFASRGGTDLSSFVCSDIGTGCNTPGAHLGNGNLPTFLNFGSANVSWNFAIRCKFLASGETTFRHPSNLGQDWGDGSQLGCPASAGAAATSGPVTLILPVAMNNAYSVLQPNLAAKMANYITRDIGQGITIDPSAKLFTFDTALAVISLRNQLPLTQLTVSTNSGNLVDVFGVYQPQANPSIAVANNGNEVSDPISQVLCYLKNNGQPCQ